MININEYFVESLAREYCREGPAPDEDLRSEIHVIHDLAISGQLSEAVAALQASFPGALEAHPIAHFLTKQQALFDALRSGAVDLKALGKALRELDSLLAAAEKEKDAPGAPAAAPVPASRPSLEALKKELGEMQLLFACQTETGSLVPHLWAASDARRKRVAEELTGLAWARAPPPKDSRLCLLVKVLARGLRDAPPPGPAGAVLQELVDGLLRTGSGARPPLPFVPEGPASGLATEKHLTRRARDAKVQSLMSALGVGRSDATLLLRLCDWNVKAAATLDLSHTPIDRPLLDQLVLEFGLLRGFISPAAGGEGKEEPAGLPVGGGGGAGGAESMDVDGVAVSDTKAPSLTPSDLAAAVEVSLHPMAWQPRPHPPDDEDTRTQRLPLPPTSTVVRIQTLRALIRTGNYSGALAEIWRAAAPHGAALEDPAALAALTPEARPWVFELAALSAQQMAAGGDSAGAMGIARRILGPLARLSPESLLPPLQRLMLRVVDMLAAGAQGGQGAGEDGEASTRLRERTESGSHAGTSSGPAPAPHAIPEPCVAKTIHGVEHGAAAFLLASLRQEPASLVQLLRSLYEAYVRQGKSTTDHLAAAFGISRLARDPDLGPGPGLDADGPSDPTAAPPGAAESDMCDADSDLEEFHELERMAVPMMGYLQEDRGHLGDGYGDDDDEEEDDDEDGGEGAEGDAAEGVEEDHDEDEEGAMDDEEEGDDPAALVSDASVRTLQEIMSLSRSHAIELLAQFGGSVEAVLNAVF